MIARYRLPEATCSWRRIAVRFAIVCILVGATSFGFALPDAAGALVGDGRANTSDVRLGADNGLLLAVVRGSAGVFVLPARPQRLAVGGGAKNLPATPELTKTMLSGDGKVLVSTRPTENNGFELVLFDVATGIVTAQWALPDGTSPDAVWIDHHGKSAGAWVGDRFLFYRAESRDSLTAPEHVERVASAFVASQSGRVVVWVDDAGHLRVVDTRSWRDLSSISAGVDRAVSSYRNAAVKPTTVIGNGGPFVYPVVPTDISADDRVLTVFLGENANTLLNICLADGTIRSSSSQDRRLTMRSMLSTTARLFAVQTTPNSDDPAFARPSSSFGLQIFETFTGAPVATMSIPAEDWNRYRRLGTRYFLDEWSGWVGFVRDESAVLRFDRASGTLTRDVIKRGAAAKTQPPAVVCDTPIGP